MPLGGGGVKTGGGVGCGRKSVALCRLLDLVMSELKGLPQALYYNPGPILQVRKQRPKEG